MNSRLLLYVYIMELMMIAVTPEYIVDKDSKKKSVILKMDEWERILDEIEELEDIRAYDKVKDIDEKFISFDEAVKDL